MLIFAKGTTLGDFTPTERWRMFRKKPGLFYEIASSYFGKLAIGGDHRHVAVTDGEVVVDYAWRQFRYWPYEQYIKKFRNINGYVLIPINEDSKYGWEGVDLGQYKKPDRSYLRGTITIWLMGLTRGLYQTTNCTTTARQVLGDAGIHVPRRVWNPQLLVQWLTENNYDFYASTPPSYNGTTD